MGFNLTNRLTLLQSLESDQFHEGGWTIFIKNAKDIISDVHLKSFNFKCLVGLKILINDKNTNLTSYGRRSLGGTAHVKEVLSEAKDCP